MVKIKHLVVDSGAFIKNVPLHEYAENIYTVNGAVKEIKDKSTRQRLQFLPYTLKIKEPCTDAYKHVLEFSKGTGDYASLSVTDLQIIALTYQLEKENVGTDHLNKEPSQKLTNKPALADKQLSGFFFPTKAKHHSEHIESSDSISNIKDTVHGLTESDNVICDEENNLNNKENEVISKNYTESLENARENEDVKGSEKESIKSTESKPDSCKVIVEKEYGDEEKENDTDSEEDDDDEGWITSKNIHEMQKMLGGIMIEDNSDVCVACISTDFAIQNVLLQIGLNVTSVDGMLIKNARVFILRCHACYKTTSNMTKQFCPNCGNKTLKRVAVTYNEEGSQNIHINFRKPINIRGTRYSLPKPQGGRHAVNPVLVEDQRIAEDKPPKMAFKKIDALTADYETLASPFAPNDISSRAASLGIRPKKGGHQKKNPNEWSIRTGNKKRK